MTTSQNNHAIAAQNHSGAEVDERQIEATLAVAFEQRTANLIALYTVDELSTQALNYNANFTPADWTNVGKQIKERLGLK